MEPLTITVDDVLKDLPEMLKEAGKEYGQDALDLALLAEQLTEPVLKLSGRAKMQALESIGHGMKSGLAAITNEHARSFLDDLITNTLKFAKTIGRAWGLPI